MYAYNIDIQLHTTVMLDENVNRPEYQCIFEYSAQQ